MAIDSPGWLQVTELPGLIYLLSWILVVFAGRKRRSGVQSRCDGREEGWTAFSCVIYRSCLWMLEKLKVSEVDGSKRTWVERR